MSKDNRSELAIKRDQWFASEEGQKSGDPLTLATGREGGKYLHNRLERAFLAGAKASDEVCNELAAKTQRSIDASYGC